MKNSDEFCRTIRILLWMALLVGGLCVLTPLARILLATY